MKTILAATMRTWPDVILVTRMKAQAATETLVTIGMMLVFVLPILMVLLVGAQAEFESLSHVQASSAVRIIADSINEVYLEGPSASKVVIVNIPSNAQSLNISNNEVTLVLETRYGPTDITTSYFGDTNETSQEIVTGSGKVPMGLYPMKFEVNNEGKVVIMHG